MTRKRSEDVRGDALSLLSEWLALDPDADDPMTLEDNTRALLRDCGRIPSLSEPSSSEEGG